MCVAKYAQITQIFDGDAMSLHNLKKEVRDEVDFLKFPTSWFQHFVNQSFLQDDTIIIDEHDYAFSKYSN